MLKEFTPEWYEHGRKVSEEKAVRETIAIYKHWDEDAELFYKRRKRQIYRALVSPN